MIKAKERLGRLLFLNSKWIKHQGYIFFLLLISTSLKGQIPNYINNGGFEFYYNCSASNPLMLAKNWLSIDSISGGGGYLNTCNGYVPQQGNTEFQTPRHGNAFILSTFFCTTAPCMNSNNRRGYLKNRLKQNLQAGKAYCVKFYVNIANTSSYGIDGFGAYFGDNSIDTITKCTIPLTYLTPQVQNPNGNIIMDTLGWSLISGTFTANGTEKYCLIGNFKSDPALSTATLNPAYLPDKFTDVCIDDVSCIPLDLPAYAHSSNDIWAIPGTTTYIGRQQDVGIDEACEWFKLPNTTSVIANVAGLTLTVAATTETYMVKQDICGVIKYDTVVVHASAMGYRPLSGVEGELKVYPQPADDIINIELSNELNDNTCTAKIFNALGQMIREEDIIFKDNQSSINTKELSAGIYYLRINVMKQTVSKRFVIGK